MPLTPGINLNNLIGATKVSITSFIQGIANTFTKPAPTTDNTVTVGQSFRVDKYAELATVSYIPDFHALADEGSYFVATNPTPGSAIASTGSLTTYATCDTQPTAIVKNNNAIGSGINVYFDYFRLQLVALPTTATNFRANWVLDNVANKYTSGGTVVTPVNVSINSNNTSNMILYFGAVSAAASSSNARLVSNDQLRGTVAATPVALLGDEYIFRFGAVEQAAASYSLNVAAGTPTQVIKNVIPVSPIILGPQQTATLRIWGTANAGTPSYEFEFGYWER